MNDSLDQFLQDFYGKYGKEQLTPDKAAKIKATYGDDHDALINDLYKKYAPDKLPDSAKLAVIKFTYGLSGAKSNAISSDANEYEGFSKAADAAVPGAGALVDLGRTAYSTVVDQVPQFAASQYQMNQSDKAKLSNVQDFVHDYKQGAGPVFARWFVTNHPEADIKTPEEELPYIEEFMKSKEATSAGLPELFAQRKAEAPEHLQAAVGTEQYIQSQKDEAAYKQKGITQNVTDVKSIGDAGSFVGYAIGQAAGQIPLSVGTFGASSYLMESSSVYDEQLDLLAKKHGISREEVIRRGLDKPAEGQAMAILAGALDAVSAGEVLGMFRKAGSKALTEGAVKKFLKGAAWEGITEGAQGNLEQAGAAQGAGTTFDPLTKENALKTLNETVAGAVGGGGLSFMEGSKAPEKPMDPHDKLAPDTGDDHLNTTIDEMGISAAKEIEAMMSRKGKAKTEKIVEKAKKDEDITDDLEEPLSKEQAAYEARMEAMAEKIQQSKEKQQAALEPTVTPEPVVAPELQIETPVKPVAPAEEIQVPKVEEPRSSRRRGKRGPIQDTSKPVVIPEAPVRQEIGVLEKLEVEEQALKLRAKQRTESQKEDKAVVEELNEKLKKVKESIPVPDKLVDEKVKGIESLNKIKKETPAKQIDRLNKFIQKYAAHEDLVAKARKQLTRLKAQREEKVDIKERKAIKAKMVEEDKFTQDENEPTFEDLEKEDKALRDMLGTDEYTSDDVEFARSPGMISKQEKDAGQINYPLHKSASHSLARMKLTRKDLKEVKPEDYVKFFPAGPLRDVVTTMMAVLNKYRGHKSHLRILVIPKEKIIAMNSYAGFIATNANTKSAIMVIPEMGGLTVSTNVHELVHDYTLMMSRFLYQNDPRFGEEINKIYINGFVNLIKIIKKGIKVELEGLLTGDDIYAMDPQFVAVYKYLTNQQDYDVVDGALADFLRKLAELAEELKKEQFEKFLNDPTKGEQQKVEAEDYEISDLTNKLIRKIYGFTNPKELLSEAFSNPDFMQLLASIPSTRKTDRSQVLVDKKDSLLYQLYKSITEYLKKTITHIANKSVFNDLMNTVTYYDLKFKQGRLQEAILEDPIWDNLHRGNVMGAERKANQGTTGYDRGVVNKIVDKLESRGDVETKADIQAALDAINKNLQTPLGGEYVNYIERALKKRKEDFQKVELLKIDAEASIVDDEYYRGNASFRNLVDKTFQVEYKKLSKKDRKPYLDGLIDLTAKKVPSKKFFDITEKYEAQERVDRLTNSKFDFANITSGIVRSIIKGGANPATLSSIIGKYNKEASKTLFTELYGNLLHMSTQAELATKRFMDKLYNVSKRHRTSATDHVKTHMYGAAYATKEAPGSENYWAEVKQNLDNIVANSENKLKARTGKGATWKDQTVEEIEKELEIAKQLRKEILEKKENAGEDKVLTPGQLELYKTFRAFAEEQKDAIMLNTQGVWGSDKFQPLFNYMPTSALGKVKGSGSTADFSNDEIIDNGQETLTAALNQPDYGQLMASRSGFTKAKVQPKGYFYDYNILSVATKWSKSVLFDTNMSHEVKVLNRMLNHSSQLETKLGQSNIGIFNDQIKGILGSGRKFSSETMRQWSGVFNWVDNYTEALMTTSGQFVTQLSSALPAAMIVKPKGFTKAIKVMAGIERGEINGQSLTEWLDNAGMGIQTRDIQFEKFQTVEDYNKAGFNKRGSEGIAKARAINSFILRSTDKAAARLVWFSAFFDAGGTLEEPTREAVLEAERAVGVLQNMSNMTFGANVFKSTNASYRIALKMFYNFKAFALNNALNTYGSAINLFNKNSDEARPMFAASLAMILAYEASYKLLVKPAYEAAVGGLSKALGGDDDDDKDDDRRYGIAEDLLTNAAWDAILGQFAPDFVNNIARMGYNETIGRSVHKHGDEKFDKNKDSPIYSKKNLAEALGSGFGAGGDAIGAPVEIAVGLYPLIEMQMDPDSAETNPRNKEAKVLDAATQAAGLIIAESTIIPIRGDLKKLIETYRRQMKAEVRNEASSGSAATSGGGQHPIVPHNIRSFPIRRAHSQQIPSRIR